MIKRALGTALAAAALMVSAAASQAADYAGPGSIRPAQLAFSSKISHLGLRHDNGR